MYYFGFLNRHPAKQHNEIVLRLLSSTFQNMELKGFQSGILILDYYYVYSTIYYCWFLSIFHSFYFFADDRNANAGKHIHTDDDGTAIAQHFSSDTWLLAFSAFFFFDDKLHLSTHVIISVLREWGLAVVRVWWRAECSYDSTHFTFIHSNDTSHFARLSLTQREVGAPFFLPSSLIIDPAEYFALRTLPSFLPQVLHSYIQKNWN